MRLSIIIFVITLMGCAEKEVPVSKENTTIQSNKDLNKVASISSTIAEIDLEFMSLALGHHVNGKQEFNSFSDVMSAKTCLIDVLPNSELKTWLMENKTKIGSDTCFNIIPYCKFEDDDTQLYVLVTNEKLSKEGEEYSDYWCLTSKDGQTICSVTNIGYTGMYPKIEKGEEKGASYSIETLEIEKLDLKFLQLDSIIAISQQHTLRSGFDWRVDQNLNINDSVAMPAVTKVYNLID